MIKHEYKDKKMGGSPGSAGNNASYYKQRYDARRIASEKNTMRSLDGKKEADVDSPDVVRFETTTEMLAYSRSAGQAFSERAKETKGRHVPKTDVERNIDEAERYIKQMATRNAVRSSEDQVQVLKKPLPSTVEINAFAPKIPAEDPDGAKTAIYEKASNLSASTAMTKAYPISANATAQTRAYGVAPGVTESTKAYGVAPGVTEATKAYGVAPGVTEATRAYGIAPGVTEATRAYGIAPGMTEPTKAYGIAPEEPESTKMFGGYAGDRNGAFADTIDGDPAEEPETEAENADEREPEFTGFEYTDVNQAKQISEEMRSRCVIAKARIIISAVLAAVLFLMENIAPIQALFTTNLAYILVDWLLAFACAVLIFDRLCIAFKSIFKWKPDVDGITLVAFCFSVAATAMALLFETPEHVVTLYNFSFAVCVFFDSLCVYYNFRRDTYSFSVLSSPQEKCAVVLKDSGETALSEEEGLIRANGEEDVKFGEIKRVNFINGYFAHKAEMPSAKAPLKIFIPFCVLISAVFFLCSLLVMKHSAAESLGVAYATFMMCAPFSAFIAHCYPLYLAARRTSAYQSAILCDKTPDAYRDTSMIVFRDTEAVPSGKAKVKSIRLYGDKKIENAIYYASSIYSAIGGPLEEVFKSAALNSVSSENVQIREICDEGVCAMVDDKNIVIGRPAYMEAQCFETVNDPGDDEYDGKTNKRIFYLACDQIVIAKFYIQYSVGADFLYIANRLFSAGIGISVRTADPCLDDGIFYENKIDPEQHAIRISRACLQDYDESPVFAKRAGIVSLGDVKDLVKALLLCKKLEYVKKTNLVLKAVASVFAVAVMALVLFTGKAPEMLSVFPALYQLFWILPTYIVAKVYL